MISASSTIALVSPLGYIAYSSFMSTFVLVYGQLLMKLPCIVVSALVSPFSFRIVVYLSNDLISNITRYDKKR